MKTDMTPEHVLLLMLDIPRQSAALAQTIPHHGGVHGPERETRHHVMPHCSDKGKKQTACTVVILTIQSVCHHGHLLLLHHWPRCTVIGRSWVALTWTSTSSIPVTSGRLGVGHQPRILLLPQPFHRQGAKYTYVLCTAAPRYDHVRQWERRPFHGDSGCSPLAVAEAAPARITRAGRTEGATIRGPFRRKCFCEGMYFFFLPLHRDAAVELTTRLATPW